MNYRLLILIASILSLTTSCLNDDDSYDSNRLIIDPLDQPMFEFGSDGIPYKYGNLNLSDEMQDALRRELLGYGWRRMQTNEIYENGYVRNEEFYNDHIGMSPYSHLIMSGTELKRYFHSSNTLKTDTISGFEFNIKTGTVANSVTSSDSKGGAVLLRIWTIYNLSGKWYMSCIEPLCVRHTEEGIDRTIWGTSHYVRMTDSELKDWEKSYATTSQKE